jgi:hypothetical protein
MLRPQRSVLQYVFRRQAYRFSNRCEPYLTASMSIHSTPILYHTRTTHRALRISNKYAAKRSVTYAHKKFPCGAYYATLGVPVSDRMNPCNAVQLERLLTIALRFAHRKQFRQLCYRSGAPDVLMRHHGYSCSPSLSDWTLSASSRQACAIWVSLALASGSLVRWARPIHSAA